MPRQDCLENFVFDRALPKYLFLMFYYLSLILNYKNFSLPKNLSASSASIRVWPERVVEENKIETFLGFII